MTEYLMREMIDPLMLPSVDLRVPSRLPQVPAVYFVIDEYGVVQYVGQTGNLRKRWIASSANMPNVHLAKGRIAWVIVEDMPWRRVLEKQLIRYYKPLFNRQGLPSKSAIRYLYIPVPSSLYDVLDGLADENRQTLSRQCQVLLEEAIATRLHIQPSL